jgi:hypothetical protein
MSSLAFISRRLLRLHTKRPKQPISKSITHTELFGCSECRSLPPLPTTGLQKLNTPSATRKESENLETCFLNAFVVACVDQAGLWETWSIKSPKDKKYLFVDVRVRHDEAIHEKDFITSWCYRSSTRKTVPPPRSRSRISSFYGLSNN